MSITTGLSAKQMVYEARIYYESIASNDAPGFTSREWSVLLTNAQNKLVYELYRLGTDNDEEGRVLIGALLTPFNVETFTNSTYPNGYVATLPEDYMYLQMDRAVTSKSDEVQVVAMSMDSYFSNKSNPFKKPTKDKVWKLIGTSSGSRIIITDGAVLKKYTGVYIKKPTPIVVETLPAGKGIEYTNNVEWTEQSDCQLHFTGHRKIVEIAARDAFMSTTQK